MSGFGRRVGGVSPRMAGASVAVAGRTAGGRSAPDDLELLSKQDRAAIAKGVMPVWANMGLWQLLGLVALTTMLVLAAVLYYGPDVVRDHRLAGTWKPAPELRAADARCKTYAFVVTDCSVKLRHVSGREPERSVSFLMFFNSGDGAPVAAVRSKSAPRAVSVGYAANDVLLNRTLSLTLGAAFFAWLTWLFVEGLLKGRYRGGKAHIALLAHLEARGMRLG